MTAHRYAKYADDAFCEVCEGEYDSLPTDCPGEPMDDPTKRAVWRGSVDFVNGEWRTVE